MIKKIGTLKNTHFENLLHKRLLSDYGQCILYKIQRIHQCETKSGE